MADTLLPIRLILRDDDAAGTPLPGGTVLYVRSGTTTPAAIFSDPAATIPQANPVVADAAGAIAPSWITEGFAVDAVVRAADGRFIQRIPNVPRYGNLSGAAGGIGFTPVDGIPATNLQDAIRLLSELVLDDLADVRPVALGGTGGSTPAAAREGLGLGSVATLDTGVNPDFELNPFLIPTRAAVRAYLDTLELAFIFRSPPLSLVPGGVVVLAHDLGSTPQRIYPRLLSVTAGDGSFQPNAIVFPDMNGSTDAATRHNAVSATTTTLTVRFSDQASSFVTIDPASGAFVELTNARWRLLITATR